jgi:hypothetical protein
VPFSSISFFSGRARIAKIPAPTIKTIPILEAAPCVVRRHCPEIEHACSGSFLHKMDTVDNMMQTRRSQ